MRVLIFLKIFDFYFKLWVSLSIEFFGVQSDDAIGKAHTLHAANVALFQAPHVDFLALPRVIP